MSWTRLNRVLPGGQKQPSPLRLDAPPFWSLRDKQAVILWTGRSCVTSRSPPYLSLQVVSTDGPQARYTFPLGHSWSAGRKGDVNGFFTTPTPLDAGPPCLTAQPAGGAPPVDADSRHGALGGVRLQAGAAAIPAAAHVVLTRRQERPRRHEGVARGEDAEEREQRQTINFETLMKVRYK